MSTFDLITLFVDGGVRVVDLKFGVKCKLFNVIDNEFYMFLKISKLSNAIQEHQLNNNEVDVCINKR